MAAIRFLAVLIGLIMPQAAIACLTDDVPISGELQRVEKRDPSGDLLTSYHIVLRDPACLKILTNGGAEERDQIRRVQFVPYDTHPAYLDKLIGARVAARGRLGPPHAPWHTADAVLHEAELIGNFSSPDHHNSYRHRKKYHRDDRDYGESYNGGYKTPYRPHLSLLDRPFERGTGNDYAIRNKEYAPYPGETVDDALRDEIIRFIAGTYLKFHHMPPETVRRYYRPHVHYRGRPKVSSEIIISEKFRIRRRWPQKKYTFDPDSVRISLSQYVPGGYDVRFEFEVGVSDRGWTQKSWHRGVLTLDIKRDGIRICREDVESYWPNEKRPSGGLARADIYPRPLK